MQKKFERIRQRVSRQIEGYDYDEISNRVEPLCEENHVVTQQDIDFVKRLIQKYRNYYLPSQLEQKLDYLSGQSSNAIVDAEHLNNMQKYMHVNRGSLEDDFVSLLKGLNNRKGKLIFLVGNVGDGKSHLIGHLKEIHPDIFAKTNINIHYDATESFDPQKTAMETLFDVLSPFADSQIESATKKIG